MKTTLITINAIFLVLNLTVLWFNRPLLLLAGAALVAGTVLIVRLLAIKTRG